MQKNNTFYFPDKSPFVCGSNTIKGKKMLENRDVYCAVTPYFCNDYKEGEPKSNKLAEVSKELWQNLGVDLLLTCKANLTTRVEKPTITGYHNDVTVPGATTAVLYINSNNGATIFENGKEYQSVANRCVMFPSSIKHASKSHTDTKRRVVLNINYLNEKTMVENIK